jgi:LysM repeat protein
VQPTVQVPENVVPVNVVAEQPAPVPLSNGEPARVHTIVKGDTLFSIARRSNTSVDSLVAANNLGSRDALLLIGRALIIPAAGAPATSMSTPTPNAQPHAEHTIVKGDTLFSLARRANTSVDTLVTANDLGSRDAVLSIGRTLIIPEGPDSQGRAT